MGHDGVEPLGERPVTLPHFVPTFSEPPDLSVLPPVPRPSDLLFDNGLGGFSADGREYVIYLEPGQHTPAPWANVIANEMNVSIKITSGPAIERPGDLAVTSSGR